MLAPVLIVIVIGQSPGANACPSGSCEPDVLVTAFQQAARRVLGRDARLEVESVTSDPPDDESLARAGKADGVVELSVFATENKARVHCYIVKDQRWVDREISFGNGHAAVESEMIERGRLLGFAVASMFASDPPRTEPAPPQPPPPPVAPVVEPSLPKNDSVRTAPKPRDEPRPRSIEFAGIASSGIGGTAAGLGASAALRLAWTGPLWARVFVAGRTGNIPKAQASTRTAQLGAGVAWALLPETQRLELGVRVDGFAGYFDASHLSEDDISPDRRSRWLAGADLLAEAGVRLAGGTGVVVAAGLEGLFGKTEIYTHDELVAVVPPFRAVAELGFRTRF